jgi:hypothetical protein
MRSNECICSKRIEHSSILISVQKNQVLYDIYLVSICHDAVYWKVVVRSGIWIIRYISIRKIEYA